MKQVLLSLSVLLCGPFVQASFFDSCIAYSQLTSLTLELGQTTGRVRTPNVDKLSCQGNCPSEAILDSVQCSQSGFSDNGAPSWQCRGHFMGPPGRFRLGRVRVQCEGCDGPQDSRVRRNSCSLKYSVETRGGSISHSRYYGRDHYHYQDTSGTLFLIILLSICCCIVVMKKSKEQRSTTPEIRSAGPNYVAGGATGYTQQQQTFDKDGHPMYVPMAPVVGAPVVNNTNTYMHSTCNHPHNSGGGGWQPGVGTGLFGGFLLGQTFGGGGSRNVTNNYYGDSHRHHRDDDYYGNDDYNGNDFGNDGGDWGGDGGFGGTDTV